MAFDGKHMVKLLNMAQQLVMLLRKLMFVWCGRITLVPYITVCMLIMSSWRCFQSYIMVTSVSETIRKPPLVKAWTALKTKKNMAKTVFNMPDGIFTPCNVARSRHWFRQVTASCSVACGSEIMKVNSPSGSTLQCDSRLWDDMPLNSFKRPAAILEFYVWFPFPHITAVDMSSCTSLRNFIQIGPPSAERNDVMSIFKMRISAIFDCRDPIMGSLKSPVKLK